jgi:GAF domain-containing protein
MDARREPAGRIADKREAYRISAQEIESVIDGETDCVANLANGVAILRERLDFFWIGVYRLVGADLVLGPFQGTVACTRITAGRGVCGVAAARGETIVVPDVHAFPGHLACDARSRSEIVVPMRDSAGRLRGVLDVDSDRPDAFDAEDRRGLEAIAAVLARAWPQRHLTE